MSRSDAPGWYGKLACQGDFASRRLTPAWVQTCDHWLAESVQASRQQLGALWLEVYLKAPVWRFAWGPGVVDNHWWFGVLMPSCDNVGRYFPLLVAQSRPQPPADRIALDHLELWWAHIARAAKDTLAEPATLDTFEAELALAPPWPSATAMHRAAASSAGGRWRQTLAPNASLSEMTRALASGVLGQRMNGTAFWWPLRDDDGTVGASYTLAPGLPPAASFAQLLAGDW